ncbi:tRNA pseudouridine(38-40) synthase TruA [Meridianimaribacter sp. CL38]|uniref:tRNA pseudouridine(38-40) synthase TruA n=1 Tax=Meridianimaribacter sp. CL38 TaxID=2213021 RepID=UPI0010388058|nr:tRNA pseudouridine(38-40) synthase TruA [Meridianimaribacter sp. CL38]TBV26670.1 tRNA pseudouridine(38-40) synthase TruA [Meridianimaribacter sp. CL38]
MFDKRYYYLIKIQYLGYRFHGWQKQPNLKTLHLMVDRTFNYILEGKYFKTLVAGRTDAMVSANETAIELFLKHEIDDKDYFLKWFNYNLPQDVRALSIEEVDKEFNIIQHPKVKEYIYLFAHGEKCHPFCAPILTTILDELDIDVMIKGAKLFQGEHNFKSYCYKATGNGLYTRTIESCELIENKEYTASFFPKNTYMLRVRGEGFGRNQIRLMMGALIKLGKGEMTLDDISASLQEDSDIAIDYIAPASGLILNKTLFK